MDDDAFDALLPSAIRAEAPTHFTPAVVARRAAELLVDDPEAWVLDVGAAVGKFCLVGALTAPKATFVGVERRRSLVRIATTLAQTLTVPNVAFLYADAIEVDWSTFDAFYLHDPFREHLRDDSPAYYLFYVRFVQERLMDARIGTRVVTYQGFGGERPPGYIVAARDELPGGGLELWIKTRSSRRARPTAAG